MRETAEEAINAMLQLEADSQCEAQRYELSAELLDTRDGRWQCTLLMSTEEGDALDGPS